MFLVDDFLSIFYLLPFPVSEYNLGHCSYWILVFLSDWSSLSREVSFHFFYVCITWVVIRCCQAWSALTNLSINNTYLRPGITPAIDYSSTNCSSSTRGRSTVKVTSNADGSFYAPSHQAHSEKSVTGTTRSFDRYSSSSPADGKLTAGKVPWVNDEVGGCKYINGMEIVPMRNSAVPARQVEPREASLGVVDDDDIRKVMFSMQLGYLFEFYVSFPWKTSKIFSSWICSISQL